MDPQLIDVLSPFFTKDDNAAYNHQTMIEPRRKIFIDSRNIAKVWSTYCNLVNKNTNISSPDIGMMSAPIPSPIRVTRSPKISSPISFNIPRSSSPLSSPNLSLATQQQKQLQFQQSIQHSNVVLPSESPAILSLMEKNEKMSPILIDIDLRFEKNSFIGMDDAQRETLKKPFGDSYRIKLLAVIQQAIIETFAITQESQVTLMMLEKDPYIKDNSEVCVGFHIHGQYCVTDSDEQEGPLHDKLVMLYDYNQLNEELECVPTNSTDDIFDKKASKVPWLMYGSRKSTDKQPYVLSHIVGMINKQHIETETFPEIELQHAFAPHYHRYVRDGYVASDMFAEHPIEYWLPIILSIKYWDEITLLRPEVPKPIPKDVKQPVFRVIEKDSYADTSNMQIVKQLLPMLSVERATKYSDWFTVCCVIYNVSYGSKEGYDIFNGFSSHAPNYDEEACAKKWDQMKLSSLSIGTLRMLAKRDNPEAYAKWTDNGIDVFMRNASSGAHDDVAKCFHRLYPDDFKCAVPSKKIWYIFVEPRWHETDDAIDIRKRISGDFVKRIDEYRTKIADRIAKETDPDRQDQLRAQDKALISLIFKLKMDNYKSSLLKSLMEYYYDPYFLDKLDANLYVLCFRNGVFDFKARLFRRGTPDDYCSLCTNIDYVEYKQDDPRVQYIYKYYEKVYTNPNIRKYALRFDATLLVGGNKEKKIPIWEGEGDNSKSVKVKLIEKALGTYAIKLPTALFTGKRTQSSAATPDTVRLKGRRVAIIQEPGKDEQFNIGVIKEYSGGDSFYARQMYSGKPTDITATHKLIVMCNKGPVVPSSGDRAFWNRIVKVPHTSTFADNNVPETEEEQMKQRRFPIDRSFDEKITEYASAAIWVWIQEYFVYEKEGLPFCAEVVAATQEYREANDIYANFSGECLRTADISHETSVSDVYTEFKVWFKDTYPYGYKLPSKIELRDELSIRLQKRPSEKSKWAGIGIVVRENTGVQV
jgi:P4 family phage/plasmid primase-like protien